MVLAVGTSIPVSMMVVHNNTLYWKYQESSNLAMYVVYSILAIYIISLLTTNIVNIMTQKKEKNDVNESEKTHIHNILYVTFLFVVLCFLSIVSGMEDKICTNQDKVVRTLLIVYACFQFLYNHVLPMLVCQGKSSSQKQDTRDKSFSLLLAYMLLLIFLVYKTFDTPYLTVLTTLFCMRSWQKLLEFAENSASANPDEVPGAVSSTTGRTAGPESIARTGRRDPCGCGRR